ncbi:MAG: preprotein translocase subunit SecG [Opitutia bacterium]|jgi:preprotein translocase subunit SecG
MSGFLIPAAIVLLFAICILGVLVVLMQRPSANAGMGAALGGGAAETVFGGESANVLTKITGVLTFLLFLLSFGLYLAFIAEERRPESKLDTLAKPPAGEAPAPVPVVPQPEAVKPTTAPGAPATPAPQGTPAPAEAAK